MLIAARFLVAETKGPHPEPSYDELVNRSDDFQDICIYLHKI
jgi:hypothetical protein